MGIKPFPEGQPAFAKAMEIGSRSTGIGGVALAPTRSGKTLCAIEAGIKLGRYILILVDNVELLRQWKRDCENHVVTGSGTPIRVGVIRADRFEVDTPIAVATIQTLARRKLDEDVRRTYGTVIVDECQSAPCATIWSALGRLDSSYVLGLTATPRRSDGLAQAIYWLCGPHIATLDRKMEADVMFLRWPYRKERCRIPKVNKQTGQPYMAIPRLTKWGRTDKNEAAKAMFADPEFVPWLAEWIRVGVRDGRRVLVMVHLRANAQALHKACRQLGLTPGLFMGTMDAGASKAAMSRNPCIATIKKAGKGVDFKPAPTMLVVAAPVTDVEQLTGRGLQPQAEHKPLLVDVVVGVKALVKQAYARLRHYRKRGFDVQNEPWVGEAA